MAQSPLPTLEQGPRVFQAIAIARGMKFYMEHGMQVNRAYTPTNMRRTAEAITKRRYPAGKNGMKKAIADLEEMVNNSRAIVS